METKVTFAFFYKEEELKEPIDNLLIFKNDSLRTI